MLKCDLKELKLGTVVATLVLGITGAAAAQAQVSIRDLRRNFGVTISGQVQCVVGNKFTLDDGTDQIVVDAGPRWFHQVNIRPGERLTVVGVYDDDDFDAYTITRSNGEVIRVRDAGGPPPWSGGRARWEQQQRR